MLARSLVTARARSRESTTRRGIDSCQAPYPSSMACRRRSTWYSEDAEQPTIVVNTVVWWSSEERPLQRKEHTSSPVVPKGGMRVVDVGHSGGAEHRANTSVQHVGRGARASYHSAVVSLNRSGPGVTRACRRGWEPSVRTVWRKGALGPAAAGERLSTARISSTATANVRHSTVWEYSAQRGCTAKHQRRVTLRSNCAARPEKARRPVATVPSNRG
jgi:hypothetical protein